MAGKLIKYASQLGPTGESSQSGSAIVKILVVLGILIVLILFAFAFYGSANEEAGESAKQPDPKTSYTETEADGKPSEPDIDKQENPNNSFWPGTSLGGVVIPPNTETGPTETEDEICSSGTSDDEQIEGCDEDVDTEVYLSISAGEQITCSIFDGSVYCWGWNWGGQLGDGTNDDSNVPVAVSTDGALAGKTVTAISSSGAHACAIADDQAYCWGSNWGGQLGDGTTDDSNVPVAVSTDGALAGKIVTAISTSPTGHHTCAIASGEAYCWGWGGDGALGNGSDIGNNPLPVPVGPLPSI